MNRSQVVQMILAKAATVAPEEIAGLLDRECGADIELRSEVESLLRSLAQASRFLGSPTADAPPIGAAAPGAAPTISAPLREGPGTKIGPYKLLQQIGEGGFGVVFMAEQEKPVVRRVALKIIKLGMDTRQVIARFEAERQALAMMDHPNIARVLDAGATETGRPFFVMELVRGDPITQYCDTNNLSVQDRLALFQEVCHAVQHAHQKGIIHRDIKPSNILVSTQDGRPHAKVIDFGIAKATAARLTEKTLFTEHKVLIGTPEYMSPEQAEGSLDIDTRTDVYSLGVLLYELLTGSTPFDSERLRSAAYGEIQRIIREVEPPKPSTRLSQNTDTIANVAIRRHTEPKKLGSIVRGDLDWIVMKALEKDRTRRYETANDLALEVERYLKNEPVLAGPPSRLYRCRKFVRRNRVMVAAAAVVAISLLAGIVGTTFGLLRAEQQRELAEKREKQTQQVSNFQAAMLKNIDIEAMGRGIRERFREQVQAALERQYLGEYPNDRKRTPEEVQAELAAFDQRASAAQTVDVARQVMDEFVLARAADALEMEFKDQPLVRAQLHDALGHIYYGYSLYSAAEPHFRAALQILKGELGAEHERVASTLKDLGLTLRDKGAYAEAETSYREALGINRKLLGDEHSEVAHTLYLLGGVLRDKGDFDAAEPLYREALAMQRKLLGDKHPGLAWHLESVATILYAKHDYTAAEPLYREAVSVACEQSTGDRHDCAMCLHHLAECLLSLGKSAEALPLAQESVDVYRRHPGSDRDEYVHALEVLGGIHADLGQHGEGVPLLREALAIRREIHHDRHPVLGWALLQIATNLHRMRELDEAEKAIRQAIEIYRANADPIRAGEFARALEVLAQIDRDRGRHEEGVALLREALAIERNLRLPDLGVTLGGIAKNLRVMGELDEAEKAAREAVEICRVKAEQKRTGPERDSYARALEELAKIQRERGQHAEGVALLREALTIRRENLSNRHPTLALVLHHTADDLRAMGALDEAENAAREAVEIYRANADRSPDAFKEHRHAIDVLAQTLVDSGKRDEAILNQREFVEDCRRLSTANDVPLAGALASLGRLLLEHGEHTEAELVLRECLAIRERMLELDSPEYWQLVHTRSVLGGALAGQGVALIESDPAAAVTKLTQAEPLLIESGTWLMQNADRIPQKIRAERRRQALERLVGLYESWNIVAPGSGKAEQAARWRVELEDRPAP